MKDRRNYEQLRQISTATFLEESTHLKLILKGVIVLVVLVVALIIWSAFITIEETATSYGTIVPKGQVQVVQHLEGGIINTVKVNDGDKVKKGQLLIIFNPTATQAELAQLRSREISLILDSERLRAYLRNQRADLLKWSDKVIKSKYNTVKNKAEIDNLLKNQKSLLASQNKSRLDQQAILKVMIERRKEKLKQATQQKMVWERHLKLLTEQFNMYKKLKSKDYISHKDYLTLLRELNKAKGESVRLLSEIEQTKQEISEAENKLKELNSDLRNKALKELTEVNANLNEVRHKIEKLEDRLKRLRVVAPIAGIVKGVRVFNGNVVQPGGLLLEIVPFDQELLVEGRIQPRDIGHIKIGDPVTVKVLTYDFARYGSIKGTLTALSASTFTDAEGKPYYKATITLSQQYIGRGTRKKYLLPGMTVEANVITGEKTLLQYILKPIHTTAGTAFRER